MRKEVVVGGRRFEEVIGAEEIAGAVERVAAEIDRDYAAMIDDDPQGEPVLLLCVLKGAIPFLADLMRRLTIPVTIDVLGLSSYGSGVVSSGTPTFTARPGTAIADRNVIVVEDIVDSGATLRLLRRYLRDEGAASVRIATMLWKPGREEQQKTGGAAVQNPEYVGFECDDRFVVGYGMDLAERMRELPGVWAPVEDQGA